MAFPRVAPHQSAPPTPAHRDFWRERDLRERELEREREGERNREREGDRRDSGRDTFRPAFTPSHRRTKPVSVSISSTASTTSDSDYLSCPSPTSSTSSLSRVDAAVSRINSLSSHDFDSPFRSALHSSTTSSTGRTPTARNTQRPYSPAPPLPSAPAPAPPSPLAERVERVERVERGTPSRSGHRVTRSMGGLPSETEGVFMASPTAMLRKPELPANTVYWTPSELAQHLAYTLRTGGPDGEDPTLPAPVIEDVISWVLRSRITGAQFLRGIDAQRGTRPPPFLPVLAALSRRMRRTLRHRRSSDAFSEADVFNESDDSDGVTRVKRLANAFDAISSCSEASECGETGPTLSVLRAQITGDNVTGYGRVTPKTAARVWTRSRRDSSISAMSGVSAADSALSGISAASAPLWRMRADSDASSSAAAVDAVATWAQQCSVPLQAPESPTATKADNAPMLTGAHDASPPPPYPAEGKLLALGYPEEKLHAMPLPEPSGLPGMSSYHSTIKPLRMPNMPQPDAAMEAHLLRMVAHKSAGIDPYRVLRRSANTPARDGESSRRTPSRSVRRAAAEALVVPGRSPNEGRKTSRNVSRDVSRDVAALTERIRELEARLIAVETPAADEEMEIISAEVIEIDEEELHEVETPDLEPEPEPEPAHASLCPNCCKAPGGFPTPAKKLAASTSSNSTRLSSSTSSRLSASASSRTSGSGSRPASRLNASTRSATREASPANTEATEATAVEPQEAENTNNEKALVPYQPVSWLSFLGIVDEYGGEPRYRDLPVYLFLMGVGVGVGFSAVVVKIVLGKRTA